MSSTCSRAARWRSRVSRASWPAGRYPATWPGTPDSRLGRGIAEVVDVEAVLVHVWDLGDPGVLRDRPAGDVDAVDRRRRGPRVLVEVAGREQAVTVVVLRFLVVDVGLDTH